MRLHKFADLFPMMDDEEFSKLKLGIKENGQELDIVLYEGKILDGRNRYKACKQLRIKPKFSQYKGDSPLHFVLSMNQDRRHLTKTQLAVIAQISLPMLEEEARKRQKNPFKAKGNKWSSSGNEGVGAKMPQGQKARSSEKVGAIFNVSGRYVKEVKKIQEEGREDLMKEMKDGKITITQAKRQIKQEKRDKELKKDKKKVKKAKSPKSLIQNNIQFSTIVIDPPWSWDDEGDKDQLGRASPLYSTMSIDEIKKLPIEKLAKKDSHIYLWITNRSLYKGFDLLKSWGYRYITCLTWCKPSIGMGNYYRGSTEQILFGVKGSLALKRKDMGTWFIAPRTKKHSEKPDKFYEMVESCSHGLYLDMFGRKKRDGWTIWGSEHGS